VAGLLLALAAGCGTVVPPHHHAAPPPKEKPIHAIKPAVLAPPAAGSLGAFTAKVVHATFPQRPALLSVQMDSATRGFGILQLLHGTAVASTADGGSTWTTLRVTKQAAVQVQSPATNTAVVLENGCGHGACNETAVEATANGGRTWRTIFGSSRFAAASLSFPSADVGFISGAMQEASTTLGGLYATTDGGLHWTLRALPCAPAGSTPSQSIAFLDAQRGFLLCGGAAVGGQQSKTFYATTDGGRSWAPVAAALSGQLSTQGLPVTGYVHSMFFENQQVGFIGLDRGGVFMTRDGGRLWQAVFGPPLPTAQGQAFSVGFSDAEHGWLLAGDGPPLYTTSDGGLTWQLVYPTLSPSNAVSFLDAEVGYGAGWTYDGTTVLRTLDGGATWAAMGDAPVALSTIEVLGPDTLVGLGEDALYTSLDGGASWQEEPFARGWYPAALGMQNQSSGWVIGYNPASGRVLFRTGDAGWTWQQIATPFEPAAVVPEGGDVVLAVGVPNIDALYLSPDEQHRVPELLTAQTPYLWRSIDGGNDWRPRALPGWTPAQGLPTGMRIGAHGLVWLWSGTSIWLSADGGVTLERIAFQAVGGIADVSFVSASSGWLLTTGGSLYMTQDGGRIWQQIASSVSF